MLFVTIVALLFATVGTTAYALINTGHPWMGFWLVLLILGSVSVKHKS